MKFDSFLNGKFVDLIILNKKISKYTDWYSWFNYKTNTDYLEVGKFPNTVDDQIMYLKNSIEQKKIILSNDKISKKLQLGIKQKSTNKLIGMVAAYNFNYFNRTCYVSCIFDQRKKMSNQLSLFKESQDLLFDHLFFKINLRKIYAGAISKKLSLISEKLWGFKKEGRLKKNAFVNGKYLDSFILGLFRENWKLKSKYYQDKFNC